MTTDDLAVPRSLRLKPLTVCLAVGCALACTDAAVARSTEPWRDVASREMSLARLHRDRKDRSNREWSGRYRGVRRRRGRSPTAPTTAAPAPCVPSSLLLDFE